MLRFEGGVSSAASAIPMVMESLGVSLKYWFLNETSGTTFDSRH
jgi:hypothetical protein